VRVRIALTLVVALLAVACGDDAGPATSIPGLDPVTTAPAYMPPTSPGGTDAPGGMPSSECIELSMALSQAAAMGMTESGDLEDSVAALQAMASAAPPQIAADFMIVAAALAEFAQTLAEAGIDFTDPSTYSSPQAQQALEEASDAFDASGIEEASERISDYLDDVCG
jgi:hypothetical protein